MACVHIFIENDSTLDRFQRTLDHAGTLASDMIAVNTKILNGDVLKVVRTDCPWAIAVFRSFRVLDGAHD